MGDLAREIVRDSARHDVKPSMNAWVAEHRELEELKARFAQYEAFVASQAEALRQTQQRVAELEAERVQPQPADPGSAQSGVRGASTSATHIPTEGNQARQEPQADGDGGASMGLEDIDE